MSGGRFKEGFGRGAPHSDETRGAARLTEVANVLAQLLGEIELVLPFLDVRSVNLFDVVMIEHSFHRLDRTQAPLYLAEQVALEHARFRGGRVHIVFENVPPGEHQVVEAGEGNKFLNLGRPSFGPLPETDRAHLSERANRRSNSPAHGFHARNKGGCNRAHAGNHHPEFSLRGMNRKGVRSIFVRNFLFDF